MGRRKIEIEPITHERNRSVTFLKRKNGLFKKAYELGVLCSVDVAVIIFEERPGHGVKLYQYCSGNIEDVVKRHGKYDGEKDARAPGDFTNNPNAKLDDVAEGDDEDVEDEDHEPPPPKVIAKKSSDAKPKAESSSKPKAPLSRGISMEDLDYLAHRPMTIPNPPMPTSSSPLAIAISGERHSAGSAPRISSSTNPHKKQRMATGSSSRITPEDDMPPPLPSGYGYHPSSAPPSYRHSASSYRPYYSVASPPHPPYNPFDYSSSRPAQYRPLNYPPSRSMPPYPEQHFVRPPPMPSQHYSQHLGYPPMMPPPPPPQHHPHHHPPQGPSASDVFASFLDSDSRGSSSGFPGLEWPVHASAQSQPPDGRAEQSQSDPNDWLDFLSGNPPSSSAIQDDSHSLSSGNSASWEHDRDHDGADAVAAAVAALSRPPSSEASGAIPPSKKRSRTESGLDFVAGKTSNGKAKQEAASDVMMKTPESDPGTGSGEEE